MTNNYKLNEIITKLNYEIEQNKAFLIAWENVTFNIKKDGKPFQNMQKNISGASYHAISYSLQPGEYEITITAYVNKMGYMTDTISCYELIRYLKDENKIKKLHNYQPKITYLEQVYKYDLEDIKNAIQERITYRKNRIISLTKQIEIVENCYTLFEQGYNNLLVQLEKNCSAAGSIGYSNNKNDIYYN